MRSRAIAVLVSLMLAGPLATASPQVESLSRCVADSTTGKDRKDLARWLFAAMAAHPEIKALAPVSAAATEDVSRVAGRLFMRLMTEACPSEVRAAVQAGGPMAIQGAFTVLGQLAMQELMSNPDVAATMGVLDRHLDKPKLEALTR